MISAGLVGEKEREMAAEIDFTFSVGVYPDQWLWKGKADHDSVRPLAVLITPLSDCFVPIDTALSLECLLCQQSDLCFVHLSLATDDTLGAERAKWLVPKVLILIAEELLAPPLCQSVCLSAHSTCESVWSYEIRDYVSAGVWHRCDNLCVVMTALSVCCW